MMVGSPVEMQTNPLTKWVESNFERIAMAAAKGIYPIPFNAARLVPVDYRIEAPIVSHQLVCSERAQILVFLIMELGSLASLASSLFQKLSKSEGIQMAVSANNEILNITCSKLAAVLNQVEIARKSIVTPPMVMSYTNETSLAFGAEDAMLFEFKSADISFRFLAAVQTV